MVRHDDERMQKESPLTPIVENGLLEQFRRGRNLRKAAALGRHGGNKITSEFPVARIASQHRQQNARG